MNPNNEDQCSKIPEMLEKCNNLENTEDKNNCIKDIKNLIQICSDREDYKKKLIGSVLSVT